MPGTILVTGATGNVGSGLIPNLTAMGTNVRALVRARGRSRLVAPGWGKHRQRS